MEEIKSISDISENVKYIEKDFAVLTNFKTIPRFEFSTRTYVAIFGGCNKGYAKISVNLRNYTIQSKDLVTIPFGSMVKVVEISDDFEGIFFIVSEKLADEMIFESVPQAINLLLMVGNQFVFSVEQEQYVFFHYFYNLMLYHLTDTTHPFYKEIIRKYITIVSHWFYGSLLRKDNIPLSENKKRQEVVVEKLIIDIKNHYKEERKVSFYAALQFITPKYLSFITKKTTGKTVSEWINRFVVLETKIQLKETTKTIQQISDDLNFPNQSAFGKYFKKYGGYSPMEYRNMELTENNVKA